MSFSTVNHILSRCGFADAEHVRTVAKRHGKIVAPMKHDEELSDLLKQWGVREPIEF